MNYQIETATRVNNRGLQKPNEDFVLLDEEKQICFLLDGITRVHREYEENPGFSEANEVTALFAAAAYRYLLENWEQMPPESLLKNASLAGNRAIVPYRDRKTLEQWQFYPGTLGIVTMIWQDYLHCVYVGDCQGMLLRGEERIYFGCEEQLKTLESMRISKAERYQIYCNHPENPLGYGIFNGDDNLEQLLQYTSLKLMPGDRIFLYSDGLSGFVQNTPSQELTEAHAEQLLDASVAYDVPPYATYADDKSLVIVTVR